MKLIDRHIFFLTILILCHCFIFSQTKKLDSLKAIYSNLNETDTNRLKSLAGIAFEYITKNPDTSYTIANKILELAREKKEVQHQANAFRIMAIARENSGKRDEGINFFIKAIALYESIPPGRGLLACYLSLGNSYRWKGLRPKALEYYLKGFKISENLSSTEFLQYFLFQIGLVYISQEDWITAKKYHSQALDLAQKLKDTSSIVNFSIFLGMDMTNLSEYKEAMKHYKKAITILTTKVNAGALGACYNGIANIYFSQSQNVSALEYFIKALHYRKMLPANNDLGRTYISISELYNQEKNYPLAIRYADSGRNVGVEVENIAIMADASRQLAHAYGALNQYKKAYENYLYFMQVKDSMTIPNDEKKINELITNYENEKKEVILQKEKELREAEKKRQQIVSYAIAGILLIVTLFSFALYRRFKITVKQKEIIQEKNREVEEKQKEIIDSITYARRIQSALITSEKYIQKNLERLNKKS